MRAAALAAAAALLLGPIALAATNGTDVEFHPPAQAAPTVRASGASWALLVFGDGGDGAIRVDMPAGATEHQLTLRRVGVDAPLTGPEPLASQGYDQWMPEPEPQGQPPTALQATPTGVGSLYLEADAIAVEADGVRAEVQVLSGNCVFPLTDAEASGREARFGQLCPSTGPTVVARPLDGAVAVRVVATGLRVAEWHHLATSCLGATRCPDSGEREAAAAGGVSVSTFGYRRLQLAGAGSAEGSAQAARILVGGPRFDLAVEGRVRLPLAEGACACGGLALDGRTLVAEGDVVLAGLHARDDGSLGARLGGRLASARLDEDGVDPRLLAGAAVAGAVAAAGLAAVLAKLAFAAFTRITPEGALRSAARAELLDAIAARPGVHERALARILGRSPGTVRHHVGVLVAQGLVQRRRDGRAVLLFDARRGAPPATGPSPLLEEPLLRLDAWLRGHPDASRADAVRHAMQAWGWSRSTAYHRLARVEAARQAGPALPAAGVPGPARAALSPAQGAHRSLANALSPPAFDAA